MKEEIWNKCYYCGRFIKYEDFIEERAINEMITPESLITNETWRAYHISCKNRSEERVKERRECLEIMRTIKDFFIDQK